MANKAYYTTQAERLALEIASLRRRSRGLLTGELLLFFAFVAFLVLYTLIDLGEWLLALSVLSLLLYFFVRYADARNNSNISSLTDLRQVYLDELEAGQGHFGCFDAGERYVDSRHPFTYDLDIFGKESLFNRMSRCVTTGGSNRLADYLSFARIRYQAEAIEALSREEAWRARFISFRQQGRIDTGTILESVHRMQEVDMPPVFGSKAAFLSACILVLAFWGVIALSVFGVVEAGVPFLWGSVQFLFVFLLSSKWLKRIGSSADVLERSVSRLLLLMRHSSTLAEVPDGSRVFFQQLDEALGSFAELDKIVRMLDRRGNVLGLFLLDALFLSDIFLVRKLIRWQDAYVGRMGEWIDAMSEIDVLVSMATFRYNHPQTSYAEVLDSDELVYEAHGLRHPFLGEKAISNDFTIGDNHYYIITGANMAGKSTFLRAVGVNYVLARNGMPVFADRLKVSRYCLFSSMRTTDNLAHGISYFNAELLRLRQLIENLPPTGATLVILDEILRGTNSLDKLNGSRLFLEYISRRHVSGIIATHDLELSKMESARFHNFCFEIGLGESVTYSYKITPGVARNQNATYLLRQMLDESAVS
ncbi:DNA mismatch repair protein MutS [Prevotella sp. KH2C16]|uniref:MutS-related protein n=1 Tax=Prevotella sp. KH2C16 TaxID=1855325 RepID=UPI0008EAF5AE|nr:DNA mismatch repair protein MutS [Prevotella sp. KH2C16]SFG45676.1 MutS domain V [Prevotella sp. KH2C16]